MHGLILVPCEPNRPLSTDSGPFGNPNVVCGKILDMAVSLIQVLGNETLTVSERNRIFPTTNVNMWFGSSPAVELVPSDRVRPIHFFENSPLVQGNNMAVSIVFDAVLDPEKLHRSLEGLVKRKGWERLGGRLRKNVRRLDPTLRPR